MPPSPQHEALCRRCGRCCYEKLIIDDCVFTTETPCKYLDTRTNLCTIYPRRHKINPQCLTVEQGIRYGVFPADCPYVKDLPHYRPAEEGRLHPEIVAMIERGEIHTADEVRAEMQRRQSDAEKKK